MSRLFEPDALRHRCQAINPEVSHRFVRGLHCRRIQLDPAGIGQFDEASGGALESLQVGGGELEPFLLPLGGDRQPVNAAAFDHEPGAQLARRQEQTGEAGIAEIISFLRPVGPDARQRAEEAFIGVAHPQAGLGREPIQPAQPLRGRFEARVVQNLGFAPGAPGLPGLVQQPFMAVPEPETLIALALGLQSQAHRLVEQLEEELRLRRMGHAKLLPVHAVVRLRLAQVQQQAMAQLAHGQGRLGGPEIEHLRRGRVAQQVKGPPDQRQRWVTIEEPYLAQRTSFAPWQGQPMGEGQLRPAGFQMRGQLGDVAVELERLRRAVVGGPFEPGGVAPAGQPLEQLQV